MLNKLIFVNFLKKHLTFEEYSLTISIPDAYTSHTRFINLNY